MTLCGLSFKQYPCNGMDILDNAGYQKGNVDQKSVGHKTAKGK